MEGSERNCLQYDFVLRFLRIAEPGDAAVQKKQSKRIMCGRRCASAPDRMQDGRRASAANGMDKEMIS